MSAYYYIVASLPFLRDHKQAPPISSHDFLDACKNLGEKDHDELSNTNIDPEKNTAKGVAEMYSHWETNLRNDLLVLRSQELKVDAHQFTRDLPTLYGTSIIAAEAIKQATPLDAELHLNRARWMKVDELSSGHYFNMEFLRGYRLKIMLQERRAQFDREKGMSAYRHLYTQVLETRREAQV